ncbi:MAG: flagellar motor protein MotB [Rhodospirillales bacterium]|nr:flagellar motor protein MotB [Rhodospirillales bacterium]
MAEAPAGGTIIIKRVKKGGHGHHGGAWKVAYADFVTAMMAFFLLLWLLNAVTEEQLKGISNYFAPQTVSRTTSGAGGILGGQVMGEGAMSSQTSSPSVSLALPPPVMGKSSDDKTQDKQGLSDEEFEEVQAEKEEQSFREAQRVIRQAIQSLPEIQALKDSLLLDNTPEGLRIQLIDNDRQAMFSSGSAELTGQARKLIELIGKVLIHMPQKIAISGHTDAVPFQRGANYGNWELSSDRALASRRALLDTGMPSDRVARVVGKADQEPLIKDDPRSQRNRRISIVLLREHEYADAPKTPPAPPPAPSGGAKNGKAG